MRNSPALLSALALVFVFIPAHADDSVITDAPSADPILVGTPSIEPVSDGVVADGVIRECSEYEETACESACIQAGPGNGPNAPKHPQLVSGGCFRDYSDRPGTPWVYTVGCACTWGEASPGDMAGGCDGTDVCL
jgi:hypothetical protein